MRGARVLSASISMITFNGSDVPSRRPVGRVRTTHRHFRAVRCFRLASITLALQNIQSLVIPEVRRCVVASDVVCA